MTMILRTFTRIVSACLALAVAGSAYAQTGASSVGLSESHAVTRVGADIELDRREPWASYGEAFGQPFTAYRARSRGMSAPVLGALIGGGAAAAVTAAAASEYGRNESGGFCGACFARWSTFTIPVGAGVGALIGLGIDRARRPVAAVPLLSPKAAGLVVTARF